MDSYLMPDTRWSLFGFNDQDSFNKHFILPCPFISTVPADLRDAYATVERLMAFAYYHYELYDEAYRKVVWMFEMAIELKMDQLIATGELKEADKKKQLYQKLDLVAAFSPLANFDRQLQLIRKVRNYHAHPQRNSFSGGGCRGPIMAILNAINFLFVEADQVVRWNTYSQLLSAQFVPWSEQPLAIWEDDSWIFIAGLVMSACLELGGELYAHCWAQHLGPDTAENRKRQAMEPLFSEVLRDISFAPQDIRAFSVERQCWLEFRLLDAIQSQCYMAWASGMSPEEEKVKYLCDVFYEDQVARALEQFIFSYTSRSHCNPGPEV